MLRHNGHLSVKRKTAICRTIGSGLRNNYIIVYKYSEGCKNSFIYHNEIFLIDDSLFNNNNGNFAVSDSYFLFCNCTVKVILFYIINILSLFF